MCIYIARKKKKSVRFPEILSRNIINKNKEEEKWNAKSLETDSI